jgi:hypothetical protein
MNNNINNSLLNKIQDLSDSDNNINDSPLNNSCEKTLKSFLPQEENNNLLDQDDILSESESVSSIDSSILKLVYAKNLEKLNNDNYDNYDNCNSKQKKSEIKNETNLLKKKKIPLSLNIFHKNIILNKNNRHFNPRLPPYYNIKN